MGKPTTECIVKGCTNRITQGVFVNNICAPCYTIITTGKLHPTTNFIGKLFFERNTAMKYLREIAGQAIAAYERVKSQKPT